MLLAGATRWTPRSPPPPASTSWRRSWAAAGLAPAIDLAERGVPLTLAARGHQVNVIDDRSWIMGGGQGIVRDAESGTLMAGADPRRDGYARDV